MAVTVPPTPIPYRLDGNARYLWVGGTVASANLVLTRPEMTATTTYPLNELIVDHPGFELGVERTAVPMFGGGLPQTVVGVKTVGDASLVLKSSEDGVDGTDFIDEGDIGHFVIQPGGDTPAYFQRVWKVKIASVVPGNAVSDFARDMFLCTIIKANTRSVIPA